MVRIFLDANVLIAGANSRTGASYALLLTAEIGLYKAVVCQQVLDEAERNIRHKIPNSLPRFNEIIFHSRFELLPDAPDEQIEKWGEIIHGNDAPILAAAVLGDVDRLITLNSKHFTQAVAQASGIVIQSPAELIRDMRTSVNFGLRQ